MAVITTTGSGNWNSTTPDAPWSGGTLPTDSDTVVVANTHNLNVSAALVFANNVTINSGGALTINNDFTVGADSGNAITNNGIINVPYNIAGDYSLTLKGNYDGTGEWKIGTSANRLSNSRTFNVVINYSASLAHRKYTLIVPPTGKLSWYGASKLNYTTLTADIVANNSNKIISVDGDITGWRAGDIIVLADDNNAILCEENPIVSISGQDVTLTNAVGGAGTTVTSIDTGADTFTYNAHGLLNGDIVRFTGDVLPTNISINTDYYVVSKAANTFKVSTTHGGTAVDLGGSPSNVVYYKGHKKSGTFIQNISNNIIVKNYDGTNAISYMKLNGDGTNQNVLSQVMFNGLGDSTQSGLQLEYKVTNNTNNDWIVNLYKCYNMQIKNLNTFEEINSFADRGIGINGYNGVATCIFNKMNVVKSTGIPVLTNSTYNQVNIGNFYCTGFNVSLGNAFTGGTLTSKGCTGTGISIGANDSRVTKVIATKCLTGLNGGSNTRVREFIGNKNVTNDIGAFGPSDLFVDIFTSTNSPTTPIAASGAGGIIRIGDYNSTGVSKCYFSNCISESDPTVYRTEAPSFKCNVAATVQTPFSLSGQYPTFYANANKVQTLTLYTRKDAVSAGAICKIRIKKGTNGRGLDETTEYDILPTTTNTFELGGVTGTTINLGTTTSAGFITLALVLYKGATAWNLNIDDLKVEQSTP